MPKITLEPEKIFTVDITCPKCTKLFIIGKNHYVPLRKKLDKSWVPNGWQVACPHCKYSFHVGLGAVSINAKKEN